MGQKNGRLLFRTGPNSAGFSFCEYQTIFRRQKAWYEIDRLGISVALRDEIDARPRQKLNLQENSASDYSTRQDYVLRYTVSASSDRPRRLNGCPALKDTSIERSNTVALLSELFYASMTPFLYTPLQNQCLENPVSEIFCGGGWLAALLCYSIHGMIALQSLESLQKDGRITWNIL